MANRDQTPSSDSLPRRDAATAEEHGAGPAQGALHPQGHVATQRILYGENAGHEFTMATPDKMGKPYVPRNDLDYKIPNVHAFDRAAWSKIVDVSERFCEWALPLYWACKRIIDMDAHAYEQAIDFNEVGVDLMDIGAFSRKRPEYVNLVTLVQAGWRSLEPEEQDDAIAFWAKRNFDWDNAHPLAFSSADVVESPERDINLIGFASTGDPYTNS